MLNTDNASEKEDSMNRTIIDKYSKTDDLEKVHGVTLEAEFTMNDTVAMLVYKNPTGSNQLRPILSRNYKDKYKDDAFGLASGTGSDYTYMDLVVSLDRDLQLPKTLYMEFEAYSWRPLYVLDADGQRLNILNPTDGSELGNTSDGFSNLVKPEPKTIFAVDLKDANLTNAEGDQEITFRVILREGKKGEKTLLNLNGFRRMR